MIILQDSREQCPLSFIHPYVEDIEVTTLDVGDYGVRYRDGHTPSIFFERKSIGDLFSTLGGGYKRFKREMIKAQETEKKLVIIIEGTLLSILKGYKHSTIKGITIVRQLFTLWVKHGVMPVFCHDRKEMSEYICHYFVALGKERCRRLGKKRLEKEAQ